VPARTADRRPCWRLQRLSGHHRAHPAHRRDARHLSDPDRADADHPAGADRPSAGLAEGDGRPLVGAALALIFLFWWLVRQTPYYDQLMAVGSDDRAAYSAGVPVSKVRFIAYVITGILAASAGLMLTALIGSADPNIGATYTLIAIAAVALGGVSLAGGRGGLAGAAIGAIDIFLLQSVLTAFNVSNLRAADRLWRDPGLRLSS